MTREDAISILNRPRTMKNVPSDILEAHEIAIKALKQESCDDCVSRKEVLEQTYNWSKDEFLRITKPFDYLRKRINALQPVTLKPNTGHWITLKDEYGDIHEAVCSCCDKNGNHKWVYCPNCGTKMESEG